MTAAQGGAEVGADGVDEKDGSDYVLGPLMSHVPSFVLLAMLSLTGCSKEEGKPALSSSMLPADAGGDAPRLERLGLAVAACTMKTGTEYGIDPNCGELNAYEDARKALAKDDQRKVDGALAPRFLGHAAGPVRALGATYLSLLSGADVSSSELIVDAMAKESDFAVLAHMVRSAGFAAERSPKVAAAIVNAAGHGEKAIRFHATTYLSSPLIPRATEKILELAEKDPDLEVRNLACASLGRHGDQALALLERRMTDPTSPSYGACFVGLVRQWANPPHFDTESERAYKFTLNRIAAKPHSDQSPGFTALTLIAQLGEDTPQGAAWRKSHTWFQPRALIKVLGEAVVDPATGFAARSGALDAALKHGATKADLEAWRKTFGTTPPEWFATFVTRLDDEIKKAKK